MTEGNESELKPLIKSSEKGVPTPRIRRLLTKIIKESVESNQEYSGEASTQPIKEWSDFICKLGGSHLRFGPLHSVEDEHAVKDKAWKHVLKKTVENDRYKAGNKPQIKEKAGIEKELVEPKGKEIHSSTSTSTSTSTAKKKPWEQELPEEEAERETVEIYLAAIRQVEQQARNMYPGKVSRIGSEFRWMMIKDGCLFLQLALLILGCYNELGYPTNDLYFVKLQTRNEVRKLIEAMFCVGNQIPLVVLRKLMDQDFFQNVIARKKWDTPPSGLCKKVLYQVLVLPVRRKQGWRSFRERLLFMSGVNDDAEMKQLDDLLHGCHNLVIGQAIPDQCDEAADNLFDLEANEYEAVMYEGTLDEDRETDDIGNHLTKIFKAIVPNTDDNRRRIFPSATELSRRAIRTKKLKSGGVRDIHFKSCYFWANLYLPALPVDDNAEVVLRNLRNYNFQQSSQNGWEVSSYLTLMSDLIQTTRDAKLLQDKGIVQGERDHVVLLPAMLNRLSSEDIRFTQKLRSLKGQIRDFSSPLIHYKGIINLIVFLTILQSLLALLAYVKPRN